MLHSAHKELGKMRKLNSPIKSINVKEKNKKSTSEKVNDSNPKRISNMKSFGGKAIVARYYDERLEPNYQLVETMSYLLVILTIMSMMFTSF
jgi:hypothetical protein